ncbi:MAG: Mur ligase family protein, partial [Gemmatimonadota bacterium]
MSTVAGVTTFEWTSAEVRRALGLPEIGGRGRRDGREAEGRAYRAVSTDSRRTRPGDLFVALRGERFDGAEFVVAAARAGAAGAIVERRPRDVPAELELFEVEDARAALGALGRHRRRALEPTLIAVTGTNGKTTVKELLGSILREGGPTYVSPGNYNNLVGVPLSLLE